MGAISNPGFTNLAQLLGESGAWLASAALLSPSAQTDLQDGAIGDLVQLSDQALQLQASTGLFGNGASLAPASPLSSLASPGYSLISQTPAIDTSLLASSNSLLDSLSANSLLDSLSANLTPSLNGFPSSEQTGLDATSTTSSFGSNLAAYEAQLQIANTQTLFGLDSAGSPSPGVNLLA